MPKASFWRHNISLMETISRMNVLLKLQNVDADSLVSLVKRRWDCIVTSIPNDLRSFNQVSLRPEYFSKERIWIWKIVSISVNFLFQIHRGISKNSIQRICAQEVETRYPVETRSIVKGGKGLCTWSHCCWPPPWGEILTFTRLFAPALWSPAVYFYNNLIDGPLTQLSRFNWVESICYHSFQ